jgi:hypothetical protein
MTQLQIGNVAGVAAVGGTGGKNINGGDNVQAGFTDPDMATVAAMRARLTAISATTYSATELNKMTYNDMVYALRLADNPATVK